MRSLTGGAVSVDFRNKRFETNSVFQLFDPQYTSELALTLTHPLLRNFGVGVNGLRIKVAQNNLQISKYQLRVVAEVSPRKLGDVRRNKKVRDRRACCLLI